VRPAAQTNAVIAPDWPKPAGDARGPRLAWLAFGATIQRNEIAGARLHGGMDLLSDQGLAFGLLVGGAVTQFSDVVSYYRSDAHALVGLSWTYRRGPWQLLSQIGAGERWSHMFQTDDYSAGSIYDPYIYGGAGNWLGLAVDASIRLGHQLSGNWSVGIAPTGTWYGSAQWTSGNSGRAPSKAEFGLVLDLVWGP
jgi:hypothetical protein